VDSRLRGHDVMRGGDRWSAGEVFWVPAVHAEHGFAMTRE
jgi:hypothetical protein